MHLLHLSLKSLARNRNVNVLFFLMITALMLATWIIFSINDKAQTQVGEVLKEYGNAYRVQENFGHIPPEELYIDLNGLPYVDSVDYRGYSHIILENNQKVLINDITLEAKGILLLFGQAGFDNWPEIADGRYPERANECIIVEDSYFQTSLGDFITIQDTSSGIAETAEVVGIVKEQVLQSALDISHFSGSVIITSMNFASRFYNPEQKITTFINGVIQGYDACVFLTEYTYGDEFKSYVASLGSESSSYTAIYLNEGFESATRNLYNIINLCELLYKIIIIISFFILLFYVCLKSYLRIPEVCIFRSMGMKKGSLAIMAAFECVVFLSVTIAVSFLLSGIIVIFFIDGYYVCNLISLLVSKLPLIASYYFVVVITSSILIAIIDKDFITKTLRSQKEL